MNRRESLSLLAGLPFISAWTRFPSGQASKKSFRIVQITDTHVKPEGDSGKHTAACLSQIMAMKQKPDIIFHTGDIIMDALAVDREGVEQQWKIWNAISSQLTIPIRYSIGNHDVWGDDSGKNHPLYGKEWAVKELGLPGRYYSFAMNGWHFIFLDSTQLINDKWYTAFIDDEQFEWLSDELSKVPSNRPVMIVSHIPVLSAAIFDWAKCENEHWSVSSALMHGDSHKVQALFRRHSNVRACISGHLHLTDHLQYDDISYLGCGAVSGNWWRSDKHHETPAGYAVLDLHPDGSFRRDYIPFKWS